VPRQAGSRLSSQTLGTVKANIPRFALVVLLGAAAPSIWVYSLGQWAGVLYPNALKWAWASFSLKGPAVFITLDVIHSLLMALAFALVLRALTKQAWKLSVAVFLSTFLVSFYGVAFIEATEESEMKSLFVLSLVGISVFLVSVVVFAAALAQYPRRAGV